MCECCDVNILTANDLATTAYGSALGRDLEAATSEIQHGAVRLAIEFIRDVSKLRKD